MTLEFLAGHYAYWFTFILMMLGLWGMVTKKNLVKKLIGMTIFQVSIIILYVSSAVKWDASVPIFNETSQKFVTDTAKYMNPLPHTLMLTAIVVGVATTGVAFALVISIYQRYKTLNEDELLQRMKEDNVLDK